MRSALRDVNRVRFHAVDDLLLGLATLAAQKRERDDGCTHDHGDLPVRCVIANRMRDGLAATAAQQPRYGAGPAPASSLS